MSPEHAAVVAAGPHDLDDLVRLAVLCQTDPDRRVASVGDDADVIRADIVDLCGDRWWEHTKMIRDHDEIIGWLSAERDDEMGRIWWLGPFVSPVIGDEAGVELAAALYEASAPSRVGYAEEEISFDDRSRLFPALIERLGFRRDPSSLVLGLDPADLTSIRSGVDIRVPASIEERIAVAAIHDELFAGTHTLGSQLVDLVDDRRGLWCCEIDGEIVGYVATEHQNDNSLYIDFVGVAPAHTGRGLGRALVSHAVRLGFANGASYAHLTVRSANQSARHLYRSLGFVEKEILVPARRGFEIP